MVEGFVAIDAAEVNRALEKLSERAIIPSEYEANSPIDSFNAYRNENGSDYYRDMDSSIEKSDSLNEVIEPLCDTSQELKEISHRINCTDKGLDDSLEKYDDVVNIADCGNQDSSENNDDVTEPRRVSTRNEGLNGTTHPVTGVPFKEKVVETETGEKIIGVFPEFDSVFDAQLPEDLYTETDSKQFEEAQRQLKDKYDSDPKFREQFSERAQYDIENGNIPPYGYTWHHSEETGKMQLLDYETHQKTGHTGGKTIWGGGNDNR